MKLLYPDTLESLQNMVAEALAEETALKIEGCGTLDGVGRPVNAQKCISMKNYTGIIDYDPAELVLVARAGTRLREVEELLASENQLLAFEPPILTA
jgi:glycolate oxidase FAD binding subunit